MTNKELAQKILQQIGGKGNIVDAWHCITRLRFNLVDNKKTDIQAIKALDGVLEAKFQGDQFQVVVGNKVANVYAALKEEIGETSSGSATKSKGKVNPINVVFDTISGIFNPILPAIVGAGLLKGIMSLLTFFGWIAADSSEYFVFNMISDSAFYFLPFLLAFSAAKKFKTNEYIAVSLAGILMYPSFAALAGGEALQFFFLPIPPANYSSTVIPIILSVLLLSYVYRFFQRVIPEMLRFIFSPLFSLVVTAPLALFFIGPLGSIIGTYLAQFFIFLFDVAGPVAGLLFGALMPFIIMTGMHYGFFPIALDSLGTVGYDIMLLPMNFVSNLAQSGATLAVGIKTRNKQLRSVALSCALSASFGITEPAMYGVTLKYKKPLYAAMAGSGVGGAIYGFFVVKAFSFSIPGITSLPTYLSSDHPQNFLFAVIGVAASFLLSFILTLVIPFKTEEEDETAGSTQPVAVSLTGKAQIAAPLSGKTIPLTEVEDDVMADLVLGNGVGIIPSGKEVIAPFDGVINMVTDSRHAVGLVSNDGIEVLIHVGLNTVSLEGEGFSCLVKRGEPVKKGQPLLTFDPELITAKGLSTTSAVIVTNTADFESVIGQAGKEVTAGEDLILDIRPKQLLHK